MGSSYSSQEDHEPERAKQKKEFDLNQRVAASVSSKICSNKNTQNQIWLKIKMREIKKLIIFISVHIFPSHLI